MVLQDRTDFSRYIFFLTHLKFNIIALNSPKNSESDLRDSGCKEAHPVSFCVAKKMQNRQQ